MSKILLILIGFCFLFSNQISSHEAKKRWETPRMELLGYQLFGSGKEKVVVLHNWFCDSTSYDPMLPYLNTEKFTYLFIDLRGYGRSKAILGEYSIKETSADVIKVVDSLGWKQFHLIGHSMSGMIVQKIALDNVSRVKSLIAITPVPASGTSYPKEIMAFLEQAALTNDENAIESVHLSTSRRYSNEIVRKWIDKWRTCSTSQARLAYLHMYSETNFSSAVKGLKTPMLVMFGEHDFPGYEMLLRETFLAWYPNAQMECCQGAGHFPMQETPPYLASCIEKFLTGSK